MQMLCLQENSKNAMVLVSAEVKNGTKEIVNLKEKIDPP
jgi:hypothetical protein